MNDVLLTTALSAAVPLWIERLRGRSFSYIQERARQCAQVIAEKGDVIQFRSKKAGESANAFNHLAEGLACLAFAPGGVRFAGLHFEANPTPQARRVRRARKLRMRKARKL